MIIIRIQDKLGVSQRRACIVLNQARKTQQRVPRIADGEARLVGRVIELVAQYGRYGYRRITAMLMQEG
jgi:putative transposase